MRRSFPPASLGVIGSGQLGRMFIQAAQRMGYRAGVLSATAETPAAQVAHWTVIGSPDHLPALRAFAERAEAVTVEFENVSAPALRWLARRRTRASRMADSLDLLRTGCARNAFWPATASLTPPGVRFAARPSSNGPSRDSGCR